MHPLVRARVGNGPNGDGPGASESVSHWTPPAEKEAIATGGFNIGSAPLASLPFSPLLSLTYLLHLFSVTDAVHSEPARTSDAGYTSSHCHHRITVHSTYRTGKIYRLH